MVRKSARQLKTFACHAPRGFEGFGAHQERLNHNLMDDLVHQE